MFGLQLVPFACDRLERDEGLGIRVTKPKRQEALEEFLATRKQDLLQLILDEKALTDPVVSGLETALKDFKATWS